MFLILVITFMGSNILTNKTTKSSGFLLLYSNSFTTQPFNMRIAYSRVQILN